MNERYRKKTTLSECQQHFSHLTNPTRNDYYGKSIIDEDDFDNQQPPQQGQNDGSNPNQQQPNPMDGTGGMDADNQSANSQTPPMDNMQNYGSTDTSMNMPSDNGMGDTEMPPPPVDDFQPTDNSEEENEDTDEVDVDDLTDAQEKLNKKMNAIGRDYGNTDNLIYSILKGISQITKKIDNDNGRIEALQKEIEKRNPTPIEKLNLRSVNDSYPFNSKPSEYWKDKTEKSNYRLTDNDNDGKEYHIYDSDLDDDSNISNSFDFDDDELSLSGLL